MQCWIIGTFIKYIICSIYPNLPEEHHSTSELSFRFNSWTQIIRIYILEIYARQLVTTGILLRMQDDLAKQKFLLLLGRHSLMARPKETVSVFWGKKGHQSLFLKPLVPFIFIHIIICFFIFIIFKKGSPGETGGKWRPSV